MPGQKLFHNVKDLNTSRKRVCFFSSLFGYLDDLLSTIIQFKKKKGGCVSFSEYSNKCTLINVDKNI